MAELQSLDPRLLKDAERKLNDEKKRSEVTSRSPGEGDVVIAVMGVTGVGKTTFIAALSQDRNLVVGHSLASETRGISYHPIELAGKKVWLMDTPGLDDTYLSDKEILTVLAFEFADLFTRKVQLGALLYLHRIADTRFGGSASRSLKLLRHICGDDGIQAVNFVTTFWWQVRPTLSAAREEELKTTFWAEFLKYGAQVVRFNDSYESAEEIIASILRAQRKYSPLAIQRQMVEEGLSLAETPAGRFLLERQAEQSSYYKRELEQLKSEELESLRRRDDELSAELRLMRIQFEKALEKLKLSEQSLDTTWINRTEPD